MSDKELNESDKNITWELNHQIIRDSYMDLIKLNQKKPTIKQVSEDCKLSMTTIHKHLKSLKFDPLRHPLRILTDDVLLSIASSAKAGSSSSQKLWVQIFEGWSEKQEITHGISPTLVDLVKKYKNEEQIKKDD